MSESQEYASFVRRVMKAMGRRVADSANVEDLTILAMLAAEMDAVLAQAAQRCHDEQDLSWTTIGLGLGITRQAARQRFGTRLSLRCKR